MLDVLSWSSTLKIAACVFHSVAIACTVFRLMYRWYTACFWWEDGWAALALAVDVPCLVSACLEAPTTAQGVTPPIDQITNWITALGFPSVTWSCWVSILLSIVHIANPSRKHRRVTFLVGCLFIIMWAATIVQKIRICQSTCMMGVPVGLSQLLMNSVASVALVSLVVWFFRQTRINTQQRIMLFSVFFATSLLISAITIFHSVLLFAMQGDGIIFIGHIKAALSLIVCNLLVIVAFIYRVWNRGRTGDLDVPDAITFTTVDLNTCFTENASADKQTVAPNGGPEENLDLESIRSTI